VSSVKELDGRQKHLAWACFEHMIWDGDNLNTLELPVLLGPAAVWHFTSTFLTLFGDVFNVDTHLLHKVVDHLFEATTATSAAATATTATTTTAKSEWN
jgi:hypothetical protein